MHRLEQHQQCCHAKGAEMVCVAEKSLGAASEMVGEYRAGTHQQQRGDSAEHRPAVKLLIS